MTDKSLQLPWEDLCRLEGDLPWTALETFADTVVADPTLAQGLFAEYDRIWKAVEVPTYIDLYIPAIFALAAPRLDEGRRGEIGSFLVDRLLEAGHEGADLNEEVLLAASGSMGPVILPKVLDTLEATTEYDESIALSWCWDLTPLAAQAEDVALRARTIHVCVRLLEQIDGGKIEEFLGISAAWTLAQLKYVEAAPLLKRLGEKCDNASGGADYRKALALLQGQPGVVTYPEPWQRPVRKWVESSWQTARQWHGQRDSVGSKPDTVDREAMRAYPHAEQQALVQPADDAPAAPPIPIVEHAPKVGRNDPCPCGSGKKYKKCCGNPAKGQATTT